MLTLKSDLAAAARKVEALPASDAALATVSGAILRLLVRAGQTEEAIAGLRERLRALEKAKAAASGRHEIAIEPRDLGYRSGK